MACDLDLVRRIRNEFAHSLASRTFQDPEVSRIVDQFAGLPKVKDLIEESKDRMGAWLGRPPTPEEMARKKFSLACARAGALLQAKVVVLEGTGPDETKRSFLAHPDL